jgi:hypothetical protein
VKEYQANKNIFILAKTVRIEADFLNARENIRL